MKVLIPNTDMICVPKLNRMGRTKFTEGGGGKKHGPNTRASSSLSAKNGFDGLTEMPWRKTPSIFQQPVTLVHTTSKATTKIPAHIQKQLDDVVKVRGRTEKPNQIFWSKRLEGLTAMIPVHSHGLKYDVMDKEEYIPTRLCLSNKIENAVSIMSEEAASASVCSAINLSTTNPIVGQSSTRKQLDTNPFTSAKFNQPFVQIQTITEQDVTQQEKRVIDARKRLTELRKSLCMV